MKYLFLLVGIVLGRECFSQETRPRIIVMTDGEVDDQSSMIRFLLYANEFDIEAIIESNSVYQRNGHSVEPWLENQLDAYEKDFPNLTKHAKNYPTAAELRALCYVGDEDSSHIVVDNRSPMRVPGMKPQIDPSQWPDTPGSDKIVEVLLDSKPGPVFIQAWGGGNTAAKAFEKLKRLYPDQYEKAVKKAVMYNIWYQDGAGAYIEQFHPEVTMLISYHFSGTWDYGSQNNSTAFVTENLTNGKGHLGKLYPQTYISEGDSPSFFYTIPNGLRSFEDPTFGGWGGHFYKVDGFKNVYRDANKGSYTRWVEQVNNDYQARLKWCEVSEYKEANHPPIIQLGNAENLTVKSGEMVSLSAAVEDPDPLDIDDLWKKYGPIYLQHGGSKEDFAATANDRFPRYKSHWWQFEEAGTYDGFVPLLQTEDLSLTFKAPKVDEPQTIHIVFEASDTGKPKLTSYKRMIITVLP
ncbi:DUF1593 domain-containing protein [Jiulongibacter sp. NS-SX5]|uniref:DUF1593 domain-containing protein n=1 Tax=Jiulongibacter sp. NS-SX5 TaxID=3463854 RepID=UPI0040583640